MIGMSRAVDHSLLLFSRRRIKHNCFSIIVYLLASKAYLLFVVARVCSL